MSTPSNRLSQSLDSHIPSAAQYINTFPQLQEEWLEKKNHNSFLNFIPQNVCFAQHTHTDVVRAVPLDGKL